MAISARSATLGSRATASRGFLGKRVAAATNGTRYVMKAGNWLPGSDYPAWIPEDLPGYTSASFDRH
jgi:light-harvesting complex I chlorophyll a/b binding protein 1